MIVLLVIHMTYAHIHTLELIEVREIMNYILLEFHVVFKELLSFKELPRKNIEGVRL